MCGSFGTINILSFNGNKIITSSGGGMALTHNQALAEKILFWATQAREKFAHYEHREIGYNYRLSNICAGIGVGQMDCLPEHIAMRNMINQRYREALSDLPLTFAPLIDGAVPNDWLTVIQISSDSRISYTELMARLEAYDIESRPFWKPMHSQPVFKDCLFYKECEEPVSDRLFAYGLCLPSGSAMTFDQQERVIQIIRDTFR
jgi:pyridoxal phosphate-dependent aminotransferase EpsN